MLLLSFDDDEKYDFSDMRNKDTKKHNIIVKDNKHLCNISVQMPELNFDELMFESQEIVEKAQKEYADKYLINEYEFYTSEPHNVYDKARKKVGLEYRKNVSEGEKYADAVLENELRDINWLQQQSKKGIKNKIKSFFSAYYKSLDGNKRAAVIGSIIVVAFSFLCAMIGFSENNSMRTFVIDFVKLVSETSFTVSIPLLLCFLFNVVKRKKSDRALYASLVVTLTFGCFYLPFVLNIGTTQIGDYYELSEYKEYYYVQFSRNPQSETDRKVYTLPAEIERTKEGEECYVQQNGKNESYITNYHINYLFFTNGGYLYFGDEAPDGNTVIPNVETQISIYEYPYGISEDYYITLLTDKVDVTKNIVLNKDNKASN